MSVPILAGGSACPTKCRNDYSAMWGRRFRLSCWLCALSIAVAACFAQDPPKPAVAAGDAEQQELMQSLADVNNSPVDMIRVLEAFLKKHPQSVQRAEIERVIS